MITTRYPSKKISIVTTFNAQKDLIMDVLERRCAWHPLFSKPAHICTLNEFKAEKNDIVIVSLVRTKEVGHLRDLRKWSTLLSRARFGLYILGRKSLFEECNYLYSALEPLFKRPSDVLYLNTNEDYSEDFKDCAGEKHLAWNAKKKMYNESKNVTQIKSIEALGECVHEKTLKVIEALKQLDGDLPWTD